MRIKLLQAKLAEKYGENWLPPIVGRIRSDYLFPSQERTNYFQHFQGQNIYFSKMPAPPPQNQMVVPQLRAQNVSTSIGEKSQEQETPAMLAAGQCRQGYGRIHCDMQ